MAYESNLTLEQVLEKLQQADRILITTHAKPDGDAYGSTIALATAMAALGKTVSAVMTPPIPASFQTLAGYEQVTVFDSAQLLPEVDLHVVVDTGAWSQLGAIKDQLESKLETMLIIDHHLNGDVEAKYKYIDAKAAACCEIMAQLIDLLIEKNPAIAQTITHDKAINENLFVGIASDTGWFRFSNVRPETHRCAAELIERGVDHSALYQTLEQTERVEKLKLMIRALDSMELLADDRAALMVLRAKDFAETGALPEETERFVDIPQAVSTVEVVLMVTEPPADQPNAPVRVSYRSKSGSHAVNVAEMAQHVGGGGHARAAGAKLNMPIDQALAQLRQQVIDTMS